jgi:hypothetical protein
MILELPMILEVDIIPFPLIISPYVVEILERFEIFDKQFILELKILLILKLILLNSSL